jgi:molybdopterin/thiamine biosynthesis adenylyltransferase
MIMELTQEQWQRYSRHILLSDIGKEGQKKIMAGKVLVIGAGGLGSSVLMHLAAAGVGTIGLADNDTVDLSNLQRQVIHATPDIGKPKALSAQEKITRINPDVRVLTYQERLSAGNITPIIQDQDYDFIIDATDNFAAKFLINDTGVLLKKPFSHGGILRFDGQAMTYTPGNACYRCIFGHPPPPETVLPSSVIGVFGPAPGILGTIQAAEAIKYFLGKGDLLTNRLLLFNILQMHFKTIAIKRNPDCPVCGKHPEITRLIDEKPKS